MSPLRYAAVPASWTRELLFWEMPPICILWYLMDAVASTCWNHKLKRIRQIEGLRHAHQISDVLSQRSHRTLHLVQIWSFTGVTPLTNTFAFPKTASSASLCLSFYRFIISNIKLHFWCRRVTPQDGDASPSGADEPTGATGGAGAMAISASSTLSLPMSQGKPSLRRIKGRIHRSKSLDSIDLLESSVRPLFALTAPACSLVIDWVNSSHGWI